VNSETKQYLELLERRIVLLGSLAEALMAARTDVVSLDIDGLESRIAQQERLCVEIRALDPQLDQVQRQCAAHLGLSSRGSASTASNADSAQLIGTFERLQKVQATVKELNNAHQALLRRSRRTIGALVNSYRSFAMTYSEPVAPRAAVEERV
jgi:hypothetical protein